MEWDWNWVAWLAIVVFAVFWLSKVEDWFSELPDKLELRARKMLFDHYLWLKHEEHYDKEVEKIREDQSRLDNDPECDHSIDWLKLEQDFASTMANRERDRLDFLKLDQSSDNKFWTKQYRIIEEKLKHHRDRVLEDSE